MKRDLLNIGALVTMVLVLALGGPWLVRQVRSLPRQALVARADQRIVTLEVGGMTCNGCASAVQSSLAAIPGVATAEVRLQQRRAYVVCDPAVADTALVAAIHRAGPGFLATLAAR
jgi:copper chaperone CopZ